MKIIGLTGGIASGKSTVSNYLILKGLDVIDADLISREIYQVGEKAYRIVVDEFGKDILNEDLTINRKKLAQIVFSNNDQLKKLNEITHPIIFEKIKKRVYEINKMNKRVCIIDAALLFESNWYNICDIKWLVYVDKITQIKRLIERDKISEEDAVKRINAQMPIVEKIKLADFIINNSGDLRYTYEQVDILLNIALNGGSNE
ncbi:dephospho-CoA kinase [Caloramator proteoclasticus]|uniref:Dephospho-CoA kinase n=1 Tax=Caloramator proteoclasticus DSM 10124 TaxID=1121262 RepID=A0A1M4TGH4_9CLOT|nr:dephospho-CoA kinase [Caloramator proteoclasticus]SHE43495.1 dephospho-CoA kinase [Caloramator proteoclasticus DSM 10124]